MKLKSMIKAAALPAVLLVSAQGCVDIDTSLGQDFIPEEQKYEVYKDTIYLDDIQLRTTDHVSGYNTSRVVLGAIRDEELGLCTRSSAFWLAPVTDSLDFGKNPRFRECHIALVKDTLSTVHENQERILQNISVFALEDIGAVLDSTIMYTSSLRKSDFAGCRKVSKGTPVYNGGDSLSFKLSDEYGRQLLDRFIKNSKDNVFVADTIGNWMNVLPSLFLTTSEPVGNGGRINMFNHTFNVSSGYLGGSVAEFKFRADYGSRKDVDTSFIFVIGPLEYAVSTSKLPTQYAFNVSESEGRIKEGPAGEYIKIEGGNGVKPVVSSREIQEKLQEILARKGVTELGTVVINKATIVLPFDFPEDYQDMRLYPQYLSPTCRIKSKVKEDYYTYANLTDASITSENQGDVDRSLCQYHPDVSFFTQKVLNLDKTKDSYDDYDIWFLILADETKRDDTSDANQEYNDYMQQLMYYNYLNSMYGGYGGYGYGGYGYGMGGYGYGGYGYGMGGYGYGGYGGYGYGDYYSNYYSMMYLSSLYSQSSSSSSSKTVAKELDRDRFYNARLTGPAADRSNRPRLEVTYSIPVSSLN